MHRRSIFTGGVLLASVSLGLAAEVPGYVPTEHARIVGGWLNSQADSRVAEDADCSCIEDLNRVRTLSDGVWKADPSFHPYYVSGDFNRDGEIDFAVGIVEGAMPDTFKVAVFDGPFNARVSSHPAFLSEPIRLGEALFFGPPRPRPYALVVGAFQSEGAVIEPTTSGYALNVGE